MIKGVSPLSICAMLDVLTVYEEIYQGDSARASIDIQDLRDAIRCCSILTGGAQRLKEIAVKSSSMADELYREELLHFGIEHQMHHLMQSLLNIREFEDMAEVVGNKGLVYPSGARELRGPGPRNDPGTQYRH